MKILAVTGRMAEKEVKKYVENVHVVDIDIAAFIIPSQLEDLDLNDYDLVLVPGMAKGNWKKLEERKGTKIRLGPIHASDLKLVMESIDDIELSHTVPACKLLDISKANENTALVDEQKEYAFRVGDVKVGGNTRMKVVAEIVDATELSKEDLIYRIEYYEGEGADIIDLGIPVEHSVDSVRKTVKNAVASSNSPISIDTFNKDSISAGIKAGADMVMSVSTDNLHAIDSIEDVATVVVGHNVDDLLALRDKVSQRTDGVIIDCLLEPTSIAESIARYQKYRSQDPETPVLMGVGNLTELIDADSSGINATIAFIGEELGVNLLFTTEASAKTRGCIRELRTATYMSKAAKLRNMPPKDLGISLLCLKEKTGMRTCGHPEDYMPATEGEFVRDPQGDFRIWIHEGRIVCSHNQITIVGTDARSITDTIVKYDLVSRLDHSAYLGRELKKAEIALKLGKNYVQDSELNFGICSSTPL